MLCTALGCSEMLGMLYNDLLSRSECYTTTPRRSWNVSGSYEKLPMLYDDALGLPLGCSQTLRMLFNDCPGRSGRVMGDLKCSECFTTTLCDALGLP